MDNFVRSYLETALWSSTDEQGDPLDGSEYADVEFTSESLARAERDCKAFRERIADIDTGDARDTQIAHDFWLTRNHHGAGSWDGDYPEAGDKLTEIAHSFGECNVFFDDGKFYLE